MGLYIKIIQQAVLFFPVVALLFTLPYMFYNYHKYGSVRSLRILIVYSLILYLICVYFLVILPLPSRESVAAMTGPRMQLIPFAFVGDILKESCFDPEKPATYLSLIKNRAVFQVLFNLLMTLPFGIYLRYYFRFSLQKTALYAFLLSLFLELTQLSGLYFYYPGSYRLFDVDDLMANTLGSVAGYFVIKPFLGILPARSQIDAESLRRGQEISMTRRMFSLVTDLFFATIVSLILRTLLPLPGRSAFDTQILLFAAYFIILPVLLKGMTPGKMLTRIRIVSADGSRAGWYQFMIRYGSVAAIFWLFPILWCFWLLYAVIIMAKRQPLFYEKLSRTKLVSTIQADQL